MKTKILVEVSARHIHLSKADFKKLFGRGKNLVLYKKLSQPGEFASGEKVTLINAGRKIKEVRILGPFRKSSQVEISLTDSYNLKLNPLPKIRVSGDIGNTTSILVKGKKSSIKLPCIIAQRHLHLSPQQARKLRLKNNQKVSMKTKGTREITFHNIIVRISENYRLALHLDTDEGNSAGIIGKSFGEIVK